MATVDRVWDSASLDAMSLCSSTIWPVAMTAPATAVSRLAQPAAPKKPDASVETYANAEAALEYLG
jgi:hypothetical protein